MSGDFLVSAIEGAWGWSHSHPHIMVCFWVTLGLGGFLLAVMVDKRAERRRRSSKEEILRFLIMARRTRPGRGRRSPAVRDGRS